ncbi:MULTISPECIES: hypothetical protein [unclassified Streptomyces]|uniref:hypothetical protein n=1 Tax=unclassified Streptomyces TaxID=2593676 RepID=UPI0019034C0A|nr:hypothetical protein [Streptomyces sp. HSG2]
MGAFSRLFRRSRETEASSPSGTPDVEAPPAAGVSAVSAGPEAAKSPVAEPDPGPTEAPSDRVRSHRDPEPDGIGIPKQQSVEAAADREAGESACS